MEMDIEWKGQLGTGGATGVVYRGWDKELKRDVAVKFFHQPLVMKDQILNHARALTQIDHPNIVKVHAIVDLIRPPATPESAPEPAIVMEFVAGQTFGDWLNNPNLTRDEIAKVLDAILCGMEGFHAQRSGHGDIHMKNILVFNGQVKILDPAAYDPQSSMSTKSADEKRWHDIRELKHLIGQALVKVNANTAEIGNIFFATTEESTVAELRAHVAAAIRTSAHGYQSGSGHSVDSFYEICRNTQARRDEIEWQDLRKSVVRTLHPMMNSWRGDKHTIGQTRPIVEENVYNLFATIGDFSAFLLSAAESPYSPFQSEYGLIPKLLDADWPGGGLSIFVELPDCLFFILNNLFGATACANKNIQAAFNLCNLRIPMKHERGTVRLMENSRWMGWPTSLGGNGKIGYQFLSSLHELSPLIRQVFADKSSYLSALGSYSLFASTLELAIALSRGEKIAAIDRKVVPYFVYLNASQFDSARRMIFRDQGGKSLVLKTAGISNEILNAAWPEYAKQSTEYNKDAYGFRAGGPGGLLELPWAD